MVNFKTSTIWNIGFLKSSLSILHQNFKTQLSISVIIQNMIQNLAHLSLFWYNKHLHSIRSAISAANFSYHISQTSLKNSIVCSTKNVSFISSDHVEKLIKIFMPVTRNLSNIFKSGLPNAFFLAHKATNKLLKVIRITSIYQSQSPTKKTKPVNFSCVGWQKYTNSESRLLKNHSGTLHTHFTSVIH